MSKDVDCSGASRAVWLVKVPKYLSNAWEKVDSSGIVGTLKISKDSQKQEVIFNLSDKLTDIPPLGQEPQITATEQGKVSVPLEHKLLLSKVDQSLCVYSEETTDDVEMANGSDRCRIAFEGVVAQRADCRPVQDPLYMKLKKNSIMSATKSVRKIKQLEKVIGNVYKPVSDHQFNIDHEKKKKEDGKRARAEKEQVWEILFRCFEEHQYWNLKDLIKKTDQPVVYLKQILKEICTYNTKNPHKNMWELKPEYRHYKNVEDGGSSGSAK